MYKDIFKFCNLFFLKPVLGVIKAQNGACLREKYIK